MKAFILALLVSLTCIVTCVKAQIDPHFSQIYAYPLWLNPALTGAFDGTTRFSANFKNQWTGITNGYQTGAISADFKATDKVSLGINMINQVAGSVSFDYFALYGTFAYGLPLSSDGTKKLSFGLQVGLINRSFDASALQFDDQYNPLTGFDPSISSGENFLTTNSLIFDSGLGIYYYDSNPDAAARLFAGASVYHINGAADPFATAGTATKLPIRFNIHGGVKIRASESLDITPGVIYIRQQQNQIRAFDVYAEFKANNDNGLILGSMLRLDDAVVAEVGYHLKNMIMGFSYDITTSPINSGANGHGGIELSLNYIFNQHASGPSSASPNF